MEKCPSLEANSCRSGQEISRLLWNQRFIRACLRPPPDSDESSPRPYRPIIFHNFLILSSHFRLGLQIGPFLSNIPIKIWYTFFHRFYASYMPGQSRHSNNIRRIAQITKLLISL
jgi:hypothetical protein